MVAEQKGRSDYFKNRRKNKKLFCVEIEKDKLEKLTKKLSELKISKVDWVNTKIDEELDKK